MNTPKADDIGLPAERHAAVLQEAEETVETNTDLLGAPELAAEAA